MTINELNQDYSKYLNQIEFESLSSPEKFAFSYLQSISVTINEFIKSRTRQSTIAVKMTAQSISMEELKEHSYIETNCYNYLENIYIKIHRLEYMHRKKLLEFNYSNSMDESEFQNWLNDLHFMTMIRNKLFEHASENFDFFSNTGNIFQLNDIFDFRVWFFHGEGLCLDRSLPIADNFNSCIEKIEKTLPIDSSRPFFEQCNYLRRGAMFLESQEQFDLFNNSLIKTGFLTHNPLELLSKAYNVAKLIFHIPQLEELNRRKIKVKHNENIIIKQWVY